MGTKLNTVQQTQVNVLKSLIAIAEKNKQPNKVATYKHRLLSITRMSITFTTK